MRPCLERNIACSEDLGREELPANISLAELLDVEAKWQHGEVSREHHAVAVDPGGVHLVERAETVHLPVRLHELVGKQNYPYLDC